MGLWLLVPLSHSAIRLNAVSDTLSFGSGAMLTASCDVAASVKLVTPSSFDGYPSSAKATAWLHNVPASCATAALSQPCATPTTSRFPPLFYCNFHGPGGNASAGPLHARILEERQSEGGEVYGAAAVVECPLPSFTDFQRVAADDGSVRTFEVGLAIAHLTTQNELPNPTTAAMISASSNWNSASVCCGSVGQGLSRALGSTSGGFAMHTGHAGAAHYPTYVTVDLSSSYPDGLALNQLKWGCHVNGFGTYQVQARNAGGTWVTITTQNMNGVGSGYVDGRVHTDSWTNDVKYTQYRVAILDCDNAGSLCGWAVYEWQWSRV